MPLLTSPLGDDAINWVAEVDVEALAAGNDEATGVESQLVQHRRMHVGHIMPVFDGVEAEGIGGAVGDASFDSAAGHPDGKTERVVVATIAVLRPGCGRIR